MPKECLQKASTQCNILCIIGACSIGTDFVHDTIVAFSILSFNGRTWRQVVSLLTYTIIAFLYNGLVHMVGAHRLLLLGVTLFPIDSFMLYLLKDYSALVYITGVLLGAARALTWIPLMSMTLLYACKREHMNVTCKFWSYFTLGAIVGASVEMVIGWRKQILITISQEHDYKTIISRLYLVLTGVMVLSPLVTLFGIVPIGEVVRSDGSVVDTEHTNLCVELLSISKIFNDKTLRKLIVYFLSSNISYVLLQGYIIYGMFSLRGSAAGTIVYMMGELMTVFVLANAIDRFCLTDRWSRRKMVRICLWINASLLFVYFSMVEISFYTTCRGRVDKQFVPRNERRYAKSKDNTTSNLLLNTLAWFPMQHGVDGCDFLESVMVDASGIGYDNCKSSDVCINNIVSCVPPNAMGNCHMDAVNYSKAKMCNPLDSEDCMFVETQYTSESLFIFVLLYVGGMGLGLYKVLIFAMLGIEGNGSPTKVSTNIASYLGIQSIGGVMFTSVVGFTTLQYRQIIIINMCLIVAGLVSWLSASARLTLAIGVPDMDSSSSRYSQLFTYSESWPIDTISEDYYSRDRAMTRKSVAMTSDSRSYVSESY